jgi:thymidylate synthase (FAD)
MIVDLIAITEMRGLPGWVTGAGFEDEPRNCARLIEAAGRNCYQSWKNPSGRTTKQYIENLIDHGHLSVLEHASATFLVRGVSRAFTHELVRHRHLSFSQLSQRYVDAAQCSFVVPPSIQGDEDLERVFYEACEQARQAYEVLCEGLESKLKQYDSITPHQRRKMVRQAARYVLPNATETAIVVTGNFRAWREVIQKRIGPEADLEFQQFSRRILQLLVEECPEAFSDLLPDEG